MKTFITRSLSGALYSVIILGSIIAGPIAFGLLGFGLLMAGISEFHRIVKLLGIAPNVYLLYIPIAMVYLIGYLITISVFPMDTAGVIILVLSVSVLIQFFLKSDKVVEKSGVLLLAFVYLPFPLLALNFLYFQGPGFQDPEFTLLISIFIITWVNDTFAYITGSLLGRHKLFKRISPNKTLEGSLGGLAFSMLAAYAFSLIFPQIELHEWMIYSLIVVIFGTFGDLFESVLKRNAGIKESGNLIPGHGGILDRIDSILIAAPAAFIYVYFILN